MPDRLTVPGWAVLAALTAEEIFAAAPADQARGFYRTLGQRLAGMIDVETVRDLEGLATAINALWGSLGWGAVRLEANARGIGILHDHPPLTLEGDEGGRWTQALPALLEGAYDAWFRALGSGPQLVTRLRRQENDVIEFCHGV